MASIIVSSWITLLRNKGNLQWYWAVFIFVQLIAERFWNWWNPCAVRPCVECQSGTIFFPNIQNFKKLWRSFVFFCICHFCFWKSKIKNLSTFPRSNILVNVCHSAKFARGKNSSKTTAEWKKGREATLKVWMPCGLTHQICRICVKQFYFSWNRVRKCPTMPKVPPVPEAIKQQQQQKNMENTQPQETRCISEILNCNMPCGQQCVSDNIRRWLSSRFLRASFWAPHSLCVDSWCGCNDGWCNCGHYRACNDGQTIPWWHKGVP